MSAGVFKNVGYAADYGAGTAIHPIRVQPETEQLTLDGTANTGEDSADISNPISAQTSKSRKGLGLHPRTVSVKFTAAAPTGYAENQIYRIPLLNKDIKAKATKGQTGSYLGVAVEVVSNYAPEIVR